MPNNAHLKVGDHIRFTGLPEEWGRSGYMVHQDSMLFMKTMIRRRTPSRVFMVDEDGTAWIAARIRRRGRIVHHKWAVLESTGWRLVRRRER